MKDFPPFGFFVASLFELTMELVPNDRNLPAIERSRPSQQKASYGIITLNYDMILENFCHYINVTTRRKSHGSDLEFVQVRGGGTIEPYGPGPNLAKLHGSVEEKKIILPSYLKGLRPKDFPASWVLAFRLLQEANEVRVIGYSLPQSDSYIRSLLHASIGQSRNIQTIDVIGLDDVEHSLESRYQGFVNSSRLRFISETTQAYLSTNVKITRTRAGGGMASKVSFDNLEEAHEEFMKGRMR